MHILHISVLIAALLVYRISAGSRMWEAPLHYGAVDAPVEISLSHEDSNNTHSGIGAVSETEKRWITIKNEGFIGSNDPGTISFRHRTKRWPDKKIRYHYENNEAEEKMGHYLRQAMENWHINGLPDVFKFEEVKDKGKYEEDKTKILLIKYNTEGMLSTSLGVSDGTNPVMNLCDSDKIGLLDVAANVAHEIGHAWGLYHEHQNPQFWTSPYRDDQQGDKIMFGDGHGTFSCEHLSDYQKTKDDLIKKWPGEAESRLRLSCQKRSHAVKNNFRGATEWLPLDDSEDYVPSNKPFDKHSIMLYPSRAGGTGTANGEGKDGRALVLTLPDGKEFPYNKAPSVLDIEGVKKLYGYKSNKFKSLLSDLLHPNNKRFEKIKNEDEGSDCSSS